jgi:hypothetical protein
MIWLSVNFDFFMQNLLFARKFYFRSQLIGGEITKGSGHSALLICKRSALRRVPDIVVDGIKWQLWPSKNPSSQFA